MKRLPPSPAAKRVLHLVGARPNLVKAAPLMRALSKFPERFHQVLVHTGQHYDANMSAVFFNELDIPPADVNLGIGSGSHAWQTAHVMLGLEKVLSESSPDWTVVYGDTNSTLAGALVCAKLGMPVVHVEAGLRSLDRSMPEEVNRVLTDQISDVLFTPCRDASGNLAKEGVDPRKVHFVGNVMIDTVVHTLGETEYRPVLADLGLVQPDQGSQREIRAYVLATLHRPSNVDAFDTLREVVDALSEVSKRLPVIFPVHPRTRKLMSQIPGLDSSGITLIEPLGYLDFLCLLRHAALAVVDSGGVQVETTYLRVPCLTVRANTEWTVTVTEGTNRLVPTDTRELVAAINEALDPDSSGQSSSRELKLPELWEGKAAARMAAVMCSLE